MIFLWLACAQQQVQQEPNIVLISVDGLRADRMGVYGNANSPTPNMDALAAQGIRFEWSFSQSNESLFSHTSLFTGRYVSEIAVPDYRSFTLPEDALLVSEVLQNYGYKTAAFVAGGHVHGGYGFNQGFTVFDDSYDFGSFFHKTPQALAWLDQNEGPFFMIYHGYDCHRPYLHAGPFFHIYGSDYNGQVDKFTRRRDTEKIYDGVFFPDFQVSHFTHSTGDPILDPFNYMDLKNWAAENAGIALSKDDVQHIFDHYDSAALAADLQIGRFMAELKDRGLWDNTLIVLTADHGEDLGDHGFFNHRSTLRDSTTRVPMILSGGLIPADKHGQVRTDIVDALDVVPTILAAAKATPPAGLSGRNILIEDKGRGFSIQEGVLPMISIRTESHRLLFEQMPLDSPLFDLALRAAPLEEPWFSLYELKSDPTENNNIIAEQQEVAHLLRKELVRWRKNTRKSTHRGVQPTDPALREALKARGYW